MSPSFPIGGEFTPKTNYTDRLPLNTDERLELRKNTTQSLNLLHREMG